MILSQEHPDRPGTIIYIPLRFDLDRNAWVEIPGERLFYEDKAEAIAVCVSQLRRTWNRHVQHVKVVRALSEHPNFELDADGITDEMIRFEARNLAEQALFVEDDLNRLLEAPGENDRVLIIRAPVPATAASGVERDGERDGEPDGKPDGEDGEHPPDPEPFR